MTAVAPDRPAPIALPGQLRRGARLAAIVAWLGACLAGYHVWRLLRADNPWPRRFLGGAARLAGVRVRVEGSRPGRGAFLLVNHVSWLDVPALAGASGAAFVAHDGLAAVPMLRWLCEMNRTVFVARHDRAGVAEQVASIRSALRRDVPLAMFAEVGSSRVDLQACKLEYSIVSPK